MKKLLTAVLVISCALFLLVACSKQPDGHDSQGKAIYLSQYQGKWVVINYWAKWCKPCLQELPELNTVYTTHRQQLVVLGVSFDKLSDADINAFAKRLHVEFPMLSTLDLAKYGVKNIGTLPTTFIISPQGKLVKTLHGPQTQASIEQAM